MIERTLEFEFMDKLNAKLKEHLIFYSDSIRITERIIEEKMSKVEKKFEYELNNER